MRKIISILLALGLVLAFSVVALPATTGAATATCGANVTLSNDCASKTGVTYTIDFVATKTLLPGNDKLSLEFGAGTTFGATLTISCGGTPVPAADITKAAPDLNFVVPLQINPGTAYQIIITGVTNPVADGAKTLTLDYEFACCGPEDFDCAKYTIKPAKSTYKFILDAGMSPAEADTAITDVPPAWAPMPLGLVDGNVTYYPGIAKDFYPPTQFCEWNFWVLNFTVDTEGCAGYDDVQVEITMDDAPEGCDTTFYVFAWNGTPLTQGWKGPIVLQKGDSVILPEPSMNISANMSFESSMGWNLFPVVSHSDCEGTYTWSIEAYVNVPAGTCQAEGSKLQLDKVTFTDKQYQWLEAFKIPLYAKWNLVSLPFHPLESDIATQLESFTNADKIMAIWHFDQCEDEWFGYPGHGLIDMVDGDAYWIRLPYNPPALNTSFGDWWVFGTDRPYEEAPVPFNYEVCQGWNMVGFTAVWLAGVPQSRTDKLYLWNWWDVPGTFADYGLIYGWGPATQTWAVQTPGAGTLVPGDGYWISFERDGFINP